MSATLEEIAQSFRFVDAFDILVATALITGVIQWMRNRSAHALLMALAVIAGLYLVSQWLRMYLAMAMFRVGLPMALLALVVIFQKDLRHGLEELAAWHPFRVRSAGEHHISMSKTLVEAATLLAQEKIGALIVLPARQNLERHLRGGVPLRGEASVPLLHSIFHAESQGHDGAVVFKGARIDRFGVQLPLSSNFAVLGQGGTRHAAALGLVEHSDALVIVVSEERGVISIAQAGHIQETDPNNLFERLNEFYQRRSSGKSWFQDGKQFAATAMVILTSFCAACLLWLLFAHEVEPVQRIVDHVPIQTQNVPADWVIESIQPEEIRVNIAGSERAFQAFSWDQLSANLDLAEIKDGFQAIVISEDAIALPPEMNVLKIEPNVIRVTAYKTQTRELPIQVATQGQLPQGLVLDSKGSTPQTVPVKVSESRASAITSIPTVPVDVDGKKSSFSEKARLQLPDGVWPTSKTPATVDVEIEISPAPDSGSKSET